MEGQPPPHEWWGKLRRCDPWDPTSSVVAWHPLIDHSADVAACLVTLLGLFPNSFQPTLLNRRIAQLVEREFLTEVEVSRLGVLATLHDFGKFNHGFQNKGQATPPFTADHIQPALALLPFPYQVENTKLQEAFRQLFPSSMKNWVEKDSCTLLRLLLAALAHHGEPGKLGEETKEAFWSPNSTRNPFSGIQQLLNATQSWLPKAWEEEGKDLLPSEPIFQHAFAGLVQLADWLGSDERFFPYSASKEESLSRWSFPHSAAQEAIQTLGLDGMLFRSSIKTPSFSILSGGLKPRPLQAEIEKLPLPTSSSTLILEDETGSGKTEAALLWFARLFCAGLVDGLYFALPTRSAALQIHRRVTEATGRLWPPEHRPPVVLAVPGYLRIDAEKGVSLPGFEVLGSDDARDPSRWAAEHPKRYLSAMIAVGTIDQVLLSALATRHSHMRAISLLRHLLVVDEVHASDLYMTVILEKVLERHRAAGGHALLMSATLGERAQSRFGATSTDLPRKDAEQLPYPSLTIETKAGRSVHGISPWSNSRSIDLRIKPWIDKPDRIADAAYDAARGGARVIILRNTVQGCLDVFDALSSKTPDLRMRCCDIAVPHHARFAREDRERLDIALEEALGKNRTDTQGVIVCATQTVQQALDIDADFLITDLAPADVLLQRFGRLHRHRLRLRPPNFKNPQAILLVPDLGGKGLEVFLSSPPKRRYGLGSVYPDLRILDATWNLANLAKEGKVCIPDQCRQWVEATTHPDALAAYRSPAWSSHAATREGSAIAQQCVGKGNCADWHAPFGGDSKGRQTELFPTDLPCEIQTRLGTQDLLVTLPPHTMGPFGQPIHQLTLPGWWIRNEKKDEKPHFSIDEKGTLQLRYGSRTFQYDAKGLRPLQVDARDEEADA